MSRAFFTSDTHLGHRNIGKFRDIPQEFLVKANGDSTLANSLWFEHYYHKLNITKRDTVHFLGDNAFTEAGIDVLTRLPGRKIAYGGNHDDLPLTSYMRAFDHIRGCAKHKSAGWLSHFPLHPAELRGKFCIHGHVHYETIKDWRYINVCCDNLFRNTGSPIISLEDLQATMEKRRNSNKVEYVRNVTK